MLKVIKILSIVFLLAFTSGIWIGCSKEPNVADPPDPVEMTVAVWPEDGTTNVARDVEPTYTFSHELNNELPNITVSIQGSGQEIVLTVIKVSSTVYRIEFTNLLDELATYDMFLHSAKGENGEILSGPLPIRTSFTTQEIILPSLILSVIFPPNNSEIPDSTSTLHYQAYFELNPSTVEPSFTLTNTTTSTQLNPIIDVSGKDIYVNVGGLLEHSSAYTAEFDPDIIRGANGEKPNTTYSFMFTTEAVYVQQPFTTPEGSVQFAGTYKDGYVYVGGIGPNDEGFTACFNSEGDSVWFHSFKVNGHFTRVLGMAVTMEGVYSILDVLPDPIPPTTIPPELWLYQQSLYGEFLNKWQSPAGTFKAIASSETDVYITYLGPPNNEYIDKYSSSGLQARIILDYSTDLFFHNGYLYVAGGTSPNGAHFITKWQADLSDSLWYREKSRDGYLIHTSARLTFASNRLQLLGRISVPEHQAILLQYDESGNLLADLDVSVSVGWRDFSSDGVYTYVVQGLYRIDINGNANIIGAIEGDSVFKVDNPSGLGYKIAVTDRTNILKLFE